MAFLDRINALTNAGIANGDTAEGYIEQWLNDGVKEVISYMPLAARLSCAVESDAFAPSAGEPMDNEVLGVIRATGPTFSTAYQCRAIPFMQRHEASDSNSVLYAKTTDPAYYLDPQTSGSPKIMVLPLGGFTASTLADGDDSTTDTNSAICKAHYINYPSVSDAATDNTLSNFPDDWEPIVVLYAAIKAAEYLYAIEEDEELYGPMINSLRADYLGALQSKGVQVSAPTKRPSANKQMQELVTKIGSMETKE